MPDGGGSFSLPLRPTWGIGLPAQPYRIPELGIILNFIILPYFILNLRQIKHFKIFIGPHSLYHVAKWPRAGLCTHFKGAKKHVPALAVGAS